MYKSEVNKKIFEIEFNSNSDISGMINQSEFVFDSIQTEKNSFHLIYKNKSILVRLVDYNEDDKQVHLRVNGHDYFVKVSTKLDLILEKFGMTSSTKKVEQIKSQMPGKVLKIIVNKNDNVAENDALLIIEAMKMENIIKSPINGEIEQILVNENQSINKGDVLLKFKSK